MIDFVHDILIPALIFLGVLFVGAALFLFAFYLLTT